MICKILLLSTLVGCASGTSGSDMPDYNIPCTSCTEMYTMLGEQKMVMDAGNCTIQYCMNGCSVISLSVEMTMTMEDQAMDMTQVTTFKGCNDFLSPTCDILKPQFEKEMKNLPDMPGTEIGDVTCHNSTCDGTENCIGWTMEESDEESEEEDYGYDTDKYDYDDWSDYKSSDCKKQVFLSTVMLGVALLSI